MKFGQFVSLSLLSIQAFSQITVGTISNGPDAVNGYTLFSPNPSNDVYLVDNCGYVVNQWSTPYQPALSAYLLDDGSLLRTGQLNNPVFTQGGSGGQIQRYDWDGNLLWDFTFSSNTYCQHHDIEYMPNGNVLILATELKTQAECIAAGRDPSLLIENQLWTEMVVEVQPVGADSGIIVWEWHAWDHLVQNFDSSKPNYQTSIQVPELFDLNQIGVNSKADWMHINSIDYNAALDQIVLGSKKWSELFVIDHSTTSAEAAGHTGGNAGKGGDLLFRWGNPFNYGIISAPRLLDNQHDVHWIEAGKPDAGKLIIFNNGKDRGYSSVDILVLPLDASGNYTMQNNYYGPDTLHWTYEAPNPTDFFSVRISGAHQLENGNVMICSGVGGHFFEVDSNKNILWEYINPVTNQGILAQGQNLGGNGNSVFRAYRFPADHPAFVGKDMTPGLPIELNSNTSHCTLYSTSVESVPVQELMHLFPNPSNGLVQLEIPLNLIGAQLRVYDLLGRLQHHQKINSTSQRIDLQHLAKGQYLFSLDHQRAQPILLR